MTSTQVDVPYLDILAPDFRVDAPEVVQAQAQSWYAHTDLGMLVLRFAEAAEIDSDPRFGPSGARDREMHGLTEGPIYDWFTYNMQNVGYARHAVLRRLLKQTVSPQVVDKLRPFARAAADRLADELTERQSCEWMESFAEPFPVAVLWQVLGAPEVDYEEFSQVSADTGLILGLSLTDTEVRRRAAAAVSTLDAQVHRMIADTAHRTDSDPLRRLVNTATTSGAGQLSYEELHNLVMTLIMGGHETTSRQLGWLAVAFARHPEQWTWLRTRPELASQAAREIMRWGTVVQINKRWALTDLTYKDVDIAAGSLVMVCHATANRDPRVYEDPARFDISKARPAPLAFGRGPHRCIGAALARMEITETLRTLSRRLPPPTLVGPVSWRPPTTTMFGPERVPLSFSSD